MSSNFKYESKISYAVQKCFDVSEMMKYFENKNISQTIKRK